jgi:SAM-dependent methyltransferase
MMDEFTADWLALREPADARARSAKLTNLVAGRLGHAAALHVLDLGAGTGANARYLARLLPARHRPEGPEGPQGPHWPQGPRRPHRRHWLLVDSDRALLAQATAQAATGLRGRDVSDAADAADAADGVDVSDGVDTVETRAVDLARAFEPEADDLCAGRDLVTASALLDLVSERWLHALARRCRESGAAVLFALTYNGDVHCSPEEPEDDAVRELVNRHQRTDKGFGAALGPAAAESAVRVFADLGYDVRRERSDWALGADAHDLQTRLIEGWAHAAAAIAPDRSASLRGWSGRRLAHVDAGRSRMVVGHDDVVGWLPRQAAR